MITLQSIITEHDVHRSNYLTKIGKCKTGKLGYGISECEKCGKREVHALSCRDRHCPMCQNRSREKWIEGQRENIINVRYYHVVATVPNKIHEIIMQNKKEMYELIMKASAESIMEICKDRKYVGGQIGILQILHTWNQQLHYHPHVHMLIPGIGLTDQGEIEEVKKEKYLVPIKAYSKKYRGKFISMLKETKKKLKFKGKTKKYEQEEEWEKLIETLYKENFNTYIKKPYKNPESVIEYFGRYAYKVAISNSRIKEYKEGQVTYEYKDRKDGNKTKEEIISAEEFIKRFSLHFLPKGFRKIRSYGILSNRNKTQKLERIRKIYKTLKIKNETKAFIEKKSERMYRCAKCGGELRYIKRIETLAEIFKEIKGHT